MTHVSTGDMAAELAETFELEPIEACFFRYTLIDDSDLDDDDLR